MTTRSNLLYAPNITELSPPPPEACSLLCAMGRCPSFLAWVPEEGAPSTMEPQPSLHSPLLPQVVVTLQGPVCSTADSTGVSASLASASFWLFFFFFLFFLCMCSLRFKSFLLYHNIQSENYPKGISLIQSLFLHKISNSFFKVKKS